ncbi:GntR family transcriptional regulator [Streptomyces sp. NPDC047718]|uniref:GntR family transcriptional regulator n=1 Tax=Streptomyces sp. NPDC047718 TaxID=3155479 RepID=UPI0033E4DD0B
MLTPDLAAAAADTTSPAAQDVTVAQICEQVRTHVKSGRYAPGMGLSIKAVAEDLDASKDLVPEVFAELVGAGVLARSGSRFRVPVAQDDRVLRARHLADRFRNQIAAGIYSPGAPLPCTESLAGEHVTDGELMRMALRLLEDEGWLGMKRSGNCLARVVRPRARQLPPPPTAPPVPRAPGAAPLSENDVRTAIWTAHNRWVSRQFQTPEAVEAAWRQMQAVATQVLQPAVRVSPSPIRPWKQAAARVRHSASAPLPDTSLLGVWHTAWLASAVRTLLAYEHARHP